MTYQATMRKEEDVRLPLVETRSGMVPLHAAVCRGGGFEALEAMSGVLLKMPKLYPRRWRSEAGSDS